MPMRGALLVLALGVALAWPGAPRAQANAPGPEAAPGSRSERLRGGDAPAPEAAAAVDAPGGAVDAPEAPREASDTAGQSPPADGEPSAPASQPARSADGEPASESGAGAAATTLPPAEPDPAVAPVLEGGDAQARAARSIPTRERPEAVIRVILALMALMALAYLGGHRRVLEWERRLGVSQVITAGLPFVVLGTVARLPSVGVLSDAVLAELSPLLRIALGSIGFVAGFRFETKLFHALPRGTGSIALLSTLVPFATVAIATAPLLLLFSDDRGAISLRDPVFVRDALILATAGAMTARSALRLRAGDGGEGIAARILRLEELAGVLGLAIVAAFFRESGPGGGWQLPGMAWLLLTLGLGTALGLVFHAILVATPSGPDFLAVTLGAIAFTAGAAGYLHLSSVAVAFVAGVILANFPGTFQPRLHEMLKRIERPIYLLALFVIGALWNVDDWRGWVLMPVFMAARLAGKWLAAAIAGRHQHLPITAEESRTLAISPIGALAIAIVVNAQLLYPGGSISLVVSAVIGGGVLTEAFVQLASRRAPAAGQLALGDATASAPGREPP